MAGNYVSGLLETVELIFQVEVSFRNRASKSSRFHGDFTSAPRGGQYEHISFSRSVTLREIESIWINTYRKRSRAHGNVEVRLRFNGKIYSHTFKAPSRESRGQGKREESSAWRKISLAEIFGRNVR